MRELKVLAVLAAAPALAGAWAPAFGSVLYPIGVLNPTNAYSEVRAISGDGTYAAGVSTSQGLYSGGSTQAGAPNTTNGPVIWSVADGLQELPDPNGTHCIAYGVTTTSVDPTNGLPGIVLAGLHEKATVSRVYKAPLSSPASGKWQDTADYVRGGCGANWPSAGLSGGFVNDVRRKPGTDGTWFTGVNVTSGGRAAMVRGDPICGGDDTSSMGVQSISGFGVQVGRYTGVTPSTARWSSTGGGTEDVPNSSGARADGYGISTDFGTNGTDFANQWISGQVQNYNGVGTTMQAFRWNRADADMTYLGSLAPAGGGDAANNSSVAYTIANNGVTGGRSYFGAVGATPGYEVATVWDTSGIWNTSGAARSVEAVLAAEGVDISAWTHLTRVYATSDDGTVLGGYGIWAADGTTRGFVAVKTPGVPLAPATINSIAPDGSGNYNISYSVASGSQFVLLSSPSLTASMDTWTRVDTNTAANGAFSVASGSGAFYRVKSE